MVNGKRSGDMLDASFVVMKYCNPIRQSIINGSL